MDPYGTWTYDGQRMPGLFLSSAIHSWDDQQMILLLGTHGHFKDETSAGGFPGFPVPETMAI